MSIAGVKSSLNHDRQVLKLKRFNMEEVLKEKITQLQMLEQRMQTTLNQKQQVQSRLLEIDSALKEIEGKSEAYKIIGTIMVRADPIQLKKDLEEKKEVLSVRINSITKQEEKIKEQAEKLQQDVQASMGKNE